VTNTSNKYFHLIRLPATEVQPTRLSLSASVAAMAYVNQQVTKETYSSFSCHISTFSVLQAVRNNLNA
jgi:hypothetical protein